jgi:Catalytic LigB subunit of aromatic ring-opening dioxygenase
MSSIVGGMASSHAYTLLSPDVWDARREVSRERFARRYGAPPRVNPRLELESPEDSARRYANIGGALAKLRQELALLAPDALVIIGDDQGENYTDTVPQFSIYTGEHIVSYDSESRQTSEHQCSAALARSLLAGLVDQGFDVTSSRAFPKDRLLSHAHAQILTLLKPAMPVVLVFVNAIHMPAPSPRRCYEFGESLRSCLERAPGSERIVLYASGGLSHFSGGYPYGEYGGPLSMGDICEEFDHRIVSWMREGKGAELTRLSSQDLLENGEIELRQWIVLLGALAERKPQWLVYEALYRGIMGMGVGLWRLDQPA